LSFHNNTPSSLVDASSYHTFQADQAIEAVRQHAHEKDWKKVLKHKSGVVVYMVQKQVHGEKMAVFKGESVIQGFTPQSVFYVIGMRKLWDDQ
jgi:NADPH-dependent glutamate synthase beta subunit-like oxidoreductase